MGIVIELIVVLVVLAVIGWAALYVIQKFELPQPAKWLVGALLLIGLLVYASMLLGAGGGPPGPILWKR